MVSIVRNNQSIAKYNFRNNWIPDGVARKLLNEIRDNKNVFLFELPDTVSHPIKELHAEIMKKRKLKKKKAKGKKKPVKAKSLKKWSYFTTYKTSKNLIKSHRSFLLHQNCKEI